MTRWHIEAPFNDEFGYEVRKFWSPQGWTVAWHARIIYVSFEVAQAAVDALDLFPCMISSTSISSTAIRDDSY